MTVFGEEMGRIELADQDVGRPRSPHAEHVVIQARECTAAPPEDEQPALDQQTTIAFVKLTVDRGAGAVVLADRLEGDRIGELESVAVDDLGRVAAVLAAQPSGRV